MIEQLTKRELEVLNLISKGYSNEEITKKLYVSITTIKTHIVNIYSKLCLYKYDLNLKVSVMRLRAALIYLREKGQLLSEVEE